MKYGKPPEFVDHFDVNLGEVMYYLYLPVAMAGDMTDVRLPPNVEALRPMIDAAILHAGRDGRLFQYVYLSARKGWATPDNPLNRPGWHADGFGSEDLNYVWWRGPGTRFALHGFDNISEDHIVSMQQFADQVNPEFVATYPEGGLYCLDRYVVHATPLIGPPGCMRQYAKVSLSNERYNLENNSHNYRFTYDWPLHRREILRNDPAGAGRDFVREG